jgi:hypothetical protein
LPAGIGCGTAAICMVLPPLELNANIAISMGEKASARQRGWTGRGQVWTCRRKFSGAG